MMPSRGLPGSNAWGSGIDEWGRIWRDGLYVGGVVETPADLQRYNPPLELAIAVFDEALVAAVRQAHPNHCLIYGTHIGPFMAGYMAMGFARFFLRMLDEPAFVQHLLNARTEWCIAQFRRAVRLGAEVIVLGDDAGHKEGPMISPALWRRLVLPFHRRIVESLGVPVIWHSDGDIRPLLPMAVEAGFAGVHGLEPAAGMDLGRITRQFGHELALIGNVDVRVLLDSDPGAVRREVHRCLGQGSQAGEGGYMLATCNSIFKGMTAVCLAELFREYT